MRLNDQRQYPAPEGMDFYKVSDMQQDKCGAASKRNRILLGGELQRTYEDLGTLLCLLDRLASCFWGCHGKEHVIEWLAGRTVSSGRAALRLIEFGHYDEAISLVRTVAEIANLVWLFYIEPDRIRTWIDLDEKATKAQYSPVKVRLALEAARAVVPYGQEEYSWLCYAGIHPTPTSSPQTHNAHGIPTLGGVYQESGQVLGILNVAKAVAFVAGPIANIAIIGRPIAERIVGLSVKLIGELPESDDHPEVTGSSQNILETTKALDRTVRGVK